MELSKLNDFDLFFYYGEDRNNLQLEIESDLLAGLIQGKRTLFYNRRDSAGLLENYPNTFSVAISMKYDIVNWVAYRNTKVSDGQNNLPDRRLAISQNQISFFRDTLGNLDIDVNYIPFYNFKKIEQLSIPITRGL